MKRSSEYRIKLQKVGMIIVGWLLISFLHTVYDHLAIHSLYAAGPAADYRFGKSLVIHMSGGLVASVLASVFLVFFINEHYKRKPYWHSLLAGTVGFFLIVAVVARILGTITALRATAGSFSHPGFLPVFLDFVIDEAHLKNALTWGMVVVLTEFLLQVHDKFGQGSLWDIIRGKYHFPQKEKRIFMFVDIHSSTTIAENLGNEKYHMLLKDFFSDITDAIIYNKGQIYQYVGDEVVITWNMKNGIAQNHCIQCFFDMQRAIRRRKKHYEKNYGIVPDFKAGIHYGEVVAGEIGIIKKDITFCGDVLNTAARLQEKCNEFGVHILSSDDLLNVLPENKHYQRKPIGAILFRGKAKKINISTLEYR